MAEDIVARLHRAVSTALERQGSGAGGPVTVAEIYQDLAPYRAVRSELGVDMNADYEHAMLRLLAGEGGFVRLEPGEVQETLQKELRSNNPNIGIFRRFAACEAWVAPAPAAPEEVESREDAMPDAPFEREDAFTSAYQPAAAGAGAPDGGASAAAPQHATAGAQQATACAHCAQPLPSGRQARFCPHCGGDQQRLPCRDCGEPMERDWRYCISCGAARA